MSRSGYSDDYEDVAMWRGAVASAMRGRRGQAFLREMLEALDALPEKRLIRGRMVEDGCGCALGVVALKRGMDIEAIEVDPDDLDYEKLGPAFGIADALAREIMWTNDDAHPSYHETPEQRFHRMRSWVIDNLMDGT